MSFAGKKGISVASGFKLQAQAPIDVRFQVASIAERDELVTIKAAYPGLTVYVTETKILYVYNGSGWDELAKGSGYTHPTAPGYKHIPEGGTVGQILKNKAPGEAEWANEVNYDAELAGKVPTSRKVNGKPLSADVTLAAKDVGAIPAAEKGVANGVASLDEAGKVPAVQLPSYVDDVLEFNSQAGFPETGVSGKIYVTKDTNKTYRWSGSAYTEISASLALGETASTAFAGDKGKKAYDHSQAAHAPANAEANVQSDWNESNTGSDAYIKNKPASLPANGGNADTVNGHMVEKDVPANAEFTDTKPVLMKGATSSTAGAAGYVPQPKAGEKEKYLRGDGTWQAIPKEKTATQNQDGLMSAADKKKLDTLPQFYVANELAASAPEGSICFLI